MDLHVFPILIPPSHLPQHLSIEACILSRVKQIARPGWMHEMGGFFSTEPPEKPSSLECVPSPFIVSDSLGLYGL